MAEAVMPWDMDYEAEEEAAAAMGWSGGMDYDDVSHPNREAPQSKIGQVAEAAAADLAVGKAEERTGNTRTRPSEKRLGRPSTQTTRP